MWFLFGEVSSSSGCWVLGMGYVILLWYSLSRPYNYFAWLSKASQELDQELSIMLAAASQVQDPEEQRSNRTDYESSNTRDVKVNNLSRSARRSRSNSAQKMTC